MKKLNHSFLCLLATCLLAACSGIRNPNYHFDSSTDSSSSSNISEQVKSNKLGSYPQTEVTDSTLKSTLTTKAGTLPSSSNSGSWTSYEYYINGSNSTDYMWYQDVTYNNEKYRGVYFTSYRPYYCSMSSSTGNSFQYNNGYYINTVYWFKYEPIEWRVLEEDSGDKFVVTEKILDSQQYYHDYYSGTESRSPYDSTTKKSVYANNYKYSDIRGWLNTDFYNTAFTSSEKNKIKTTTVDNSVSSTGYTSNSYACENTNDKIYLLSAEEALNTNYFSDANDRKVTATDYAKCQGVYENSSYQTSYYWLRSPSYSNSYSAQYVNYDGYVDRDSVNITDSGVRPALQISVI